MFRDFYLIATLLYILSSCVYKTFKMNIPQNYQPAAITTIGENIRKWRKEKGIKQADFAKKLHLSAKILRKIEQNKVAVNHLQLRIIAAQLKIKFSQLIIDPISYCQINCELSFN